MSAVNVGEAPLAVGENRYDPINAFIASGRVKVDRSEVEAERDVFMAANPELIVLLDEVVDKLLDPTDCLANGTVDGQDGEHTLYTTLLPAIDTRYKPSGSTCFDISFVLDHIVRQRTGNRSFVRSVGPGYYHPPRFAGADRPTTGFYSFGVDDASSPSTIDVCRPPVMLALSSSSDAITIVSRLPDEVLQNKDDGDRAALLLGLAETAVEECLRQQLASAFVEARAALTEPTISPGAITAMLKVLKDDEQPLIYLTGSDDYQASHWRSSRLTPGVVLRLTQIAIADRNLGRQS